MESFNFWNVREAPGWLREFPGRILKVALHPPHKPVCTPETRFCDLGIVIFVILGSIFLHFRCLLSPKFLKYNFVRPVGPGPREFSKCGQHRLASATLGHTDAEVRGGPCKLLKLL